VSNLEDRLAQRLVDRPHPLMAAFRAFPRNARRHAEFWLREGYLHPEAHFLITERLAPWIDRVGAAGADLRTILMAELAPPEEETEKDAKTGSASLDFIDEFGAKNHHLYYPTCGDFLGSDGAVKPAENLDFSAARKNQLLDDEGEPITRNPGHIWNAEQGAINAAAYAMAPEIPPIPEWARVQLPKNPDPSRLRRDPEKKAFRLIPRLTTRCVDCCGRTIFGDKIECGLCDGRVTKPKRFQPGVARTPCRYCGAGCRSGVICLDCQPIVARVKASGITVDDQILLEMKARLSAADRRGRKQETVTDLQRRRARNKHQRDRRQEERRGAKEAGQGGEPEEEVFANAARCRGRLEVLRPQLGTSASDALREGRRRS
jgi:hypothetical protein